MDRQPDPAGLLVKAGLGILALGVVGYLVTLIAVSFTARPHSFEDLTAVWRHAGPTALGATATVTVPPGDTLVAFLVGTDLTGIAGTTGGDCAATSQGRSLVLDWPVQIDTVLTGLLEPGQQTVPIAGWRNDDSHDSVVEITCSTADSTVDYFVAVPTRSGEVVRAPWFQPWLWAGIGGIGVLLLSAGVATGLPRGSSR